jgi:hypothetical protein
MTTIKAGRTMKALRAGQGSSDVLVDLDGTGYTTIGSIQSEVTVNGVTTATVSAPSRSRS